MNKFTKMFICNITLLMLFGCTSGMNEESNTDSSVKDSALQYEEEIDDNTEDINLQGTEVNESAPTTKTEEDMNSDSGKESSEETESDEQNEELSSYSSEEIEYARVWLQLGMIKDVEGLYVRHIQAGELVNPNDDTSVKYPEDVIQLSGGRLVAGSVTYSSNGDGTINVYSVPLRWDSSPDLEEGVMREVTEDMINNLKLVYVDTGDNKEIINLIDVIIIQ
ncbi:hypothetical protein [Paraliobacillus zengyii]|uniref:hypothetical protein n=1 Tax=Paraliobacillus zengyii TaxID=2213194 RepID=UPI000DD36E03|nr:hypothetical protein [Paraliobacillus zengyii]